MSLEGRTAIITGATAGIGEATLRLFAARGARVVALARGAAAGERLAAELAPQVVFVAADITDPATPAAAIDVARERFGRLDILVNNAAMDFTRPLLETTDDDIRTVLEPDFVAPFRMLREAALAMAATGGGAIVNVSSRLASIGVPNMGLYGAAKGALSALTRHAAIELAGAGIRVNDVAPGLTETPLVTAWLAGHDDPDAVRQAAAAAIPQGRLASPEDVAAAIAFLASDDAAHVTGVSLAVDGGYTAR